MTRWTILAAALLCMIVVVGCVNVEVPDGPLVDLDGEQKVEPTKENIEFTREFLDQAREDGVITKSQYEDLAKRLKDGDD